MTSTAPPSTTSVLLIGGGAIGVVHVPRVLGLLGARHLTIVEVSPARAGELRRLYRRDARITVVDALPASGTWDLALICTPPKFHASYYRDLRERVRAFVIEKPLTLRAADAREMAEDGARGGPPVYVHLMRRMLRSYDLVRAWHREGRFGPLHDAEIHEGAVFAWNAVSLGSFSKDLNGGGVLFDTGAHTLDLLLMVFDRLEVRESYMDADPGGIEANCALRMTGDGSVPVLVNLSRNRSLSNEAVFRFAEATVRVGIRSNLLRVEDRAGAYGVLPDGVSPETEPPTFAALMNAFYNERVARGENRGVGPAESLAALEPMERAYETARPFPGGF